MTREIMDQVDYQTNRFPLSPSFFLFFLFCSLESFDLTYMILHALEKRVATSVSDVFFLSNSRLIENERDRVICTSVRRIT